MEPFGPAFAGLPVDAKRSLARRQWLAFEAPSMLQHLRDLAAGGRLDPSEGRLDDHVGLVVAEARTAAREFQEAAGRWLPCCEGPDRIPPSIRRLLPCGPVHTATEAVPYFVSGLVGGAVIPPESDRREFAEQLGREAAIFAVIGVALRVTRNQSRRGRKYNTKPRPLTDKELEAVGAVAANAGSYTKAAKALGIKATQVRARHQKGMRKLDRTGGKMPRTFSMPIDHRGQENVSSDIRRQ
jgi:hypothetical protein